MVVSEQEAIRNGMAWITSRLKGARNALTDVQAHVEREEELDDKLMGKLCWMLAKAGVPPVFSVDALSLIFEPVADRDTITAFVNAGWESACGESSQAPKRNYGVMSPSALRNLAPGMSIEKIAAVVARHDKRLTDMIYCDCRNGSICWTNEDPDKRVEQFCAFIGIDVPAESFGSRRFVDLHAMKIVEWIDTVYYNHGMRSWREIVGWIVASLKQVNPLVAMLKACADKAETASPITAEERTELLETWLLKTFPGLPDSQLVRTYSRKWLLGGVARAVDPGVFIKAMLVIVSAHHSAGKTSILRALAGDFYLSVKQSNLNDKDAQMLCHYAWLQEFEEMATFSKAAVEHVKAYITTQEDKLRLPYGRAIESMSRPCFYAGSANTNELLKDPTGSVRFWCVELPAGCFADFKWFYENRDRVLGSAYRIWEEARSLLVKADGSTESSAERSSRIDALLNLSRAEVDALEDANQAFKQTDGLEDTVTEAAYKACTLRADGAPVLPLRCSWEDLAGYLGRPDFNGRVHLPDALGFQHQSRWKKILQENGWQYTRKRVKRAGSNISDVSGMLWFAPAECEERYNAEPPLASVGGNVIEMKKVNVALTS